jgi:antitoxin MazE
MHTSLRKMGNSTGLIVPRAMLIEMGVGTGATMDVRIEDGRLVAVPIKTPPRAGWADAAATVAGDPVDADWLDLANGGDADLRW